MFFESRALWDAMAGTMTFFLREGKAPGFRVQGLGFRVWGFSRDEDPYP